MKKLYTLFKSTSLFIFSAALLAQSKPVFGQSICGGVAENFNNTGGSTAGFIGDFSLGMNGSNGYLAKDNVIASGVYTVTTPTYQASNGAAFIGFGFTLDGTNRVARAEVKIIYVSSLNGEMTTVFLGQFVPAYNPGTSVADICRAVSLADLPGFPTGGRYRLRIELTPNTGTGVDGETITVDDFRTTGTIAQIPLPVNFIGFEARKAGNGNLLTWRVAGEENVARYEVERSDDGRTFATIGSVTKLGKDTYSYTDGSSSATVYYRIKNVDNDSKYKYSTILRIVNGRSDIVLRAFPQPVQSQLTLQHPTVNGKALLSISTADGKVVRSLAPANGSMQTAVDMSGLQAGMYMLRYSNGTGSVQTLKILKQ